ncbi:hypothetical protein C8F01DRAFT_1112378 [Mycena amicta]|nr:hypothetical protein C8F01DRAFT_1112378 [Mycena amicta]
MASNESTSPSPTASAELKVPEKDEKYYFEDGDCTFLVEGVLFKLHKFNLRRDPESMFCNLFKDAKGDKSETILLDDSAEDFRALCWVMYALPSEMYSISTTPGSVDVRQYLRILEVAHKYILAHYESWAWMMARLVPSALPSYLDTCSEDDLEHILSMALRCKSSAPELFDLVEVAWIARIKQEKVSYQRTLTVGELYGLRILQAGVYMELRKQITSGPAVASAEHGFAHFQLSYMQLHRLLLGHALLSNLARAQIPTNIQTLPRSAGRYCDYHYNCQNYWSNFLHNIHGAASLERTRASASANGYPCVVEYVDTLTASLNPPMTLVADYFLGPQPVL